MRIANSITWVTVRHHSASLVMPNSYPAWRNFHFAHKNHYGFFFLHTLPSTIGFRLEYSLFYDIYLKVDQFAVKNCAVRLLSMMLTVKRFAEAQWVAKDPSFLHAGSEDSDQTGRMSRLIWVFAGRTFHFVGFVMRRLKYVGNNIKFPSNC